mgnify:CR=1 FL=1
MVFYKLFLIFFLGFILTVLEDKANSSTLEEVKASVCLKLPNNCVPLGEDSLAFVDRAGKFSIIDKHGTWSPEGLYKVIKILPYRNMVLIFTPWIIERPGSTRILDNNGNPIDAARPGDVFLVNKDHKWANICHGNIGDVEVVGKDIFVTYEGGYVLWYNGATNNIESELRYRESFTLGPYFIDIDGREVHIENIYSYPPSIKKDPSLKTEYHLDEANWLFWPVGSAELDLKFSKDEKGHVTRTYYFNKMATYE